jgi:predicted nuclease with TOPRIM domain
MTYRELIILIENIKLNLKDQETKGQKKLFKIYEKLKSHIDDFQAKIEEARLDHAAVDDKGNLILDEKGSYKYNKDGLKKLNADLKKIEDSEFDYKKIEVMNPEGLEPYFFLQDWTNGVEYLHPPKQEECEL